MTNRHNQTIIITGASTGIGKHCALHLDQLGFRVFAGVRNVADGEALRHQASARLEPLFIDVTNETTIDSAAKIVGQVVGERGIAGLVNNAGIAVGGPLEFLPMADLRRQWEINVLGQVAVTQAFLPLLRQGKGRIINMSSISGRVASPFLAPYAASKFALEALSDSLRVELRPWGIEVILIEPGAVATPIWEKSIAAHQQMVDQLPPAAHQLYGSVIKKLFANLHQVGQRGIPPEKVAVAVAHALTAPRPKTRYLVGWDAWFAARFIPLLPDRLRDWLITRGGKR